MVLSELKRKDQWTWGRWFFLGIMAALLSSFVPFSLFAPVPLSMAFLLYGRTKGFLLSGILLVVLSLVSIFLELGPMLSSAFLVATIFSVVVSEIIRRGLDPVSGLFAGSALIIIFAVTVLGAFVIASGISLQAEIEKVVILTIDRFRSENAEFLKSGEGDAHEILSAISDPKLIAKEILNWGPSVMIGGVFLGIWIALSLVLRNAIIWKTQLKYPFTFRDLTLFKVPSLFIWPLIAGLFLAAFGENLLGGNGEVIGGNILYSIGILYLFQGFGVFIDLLSFLHIFGIFRTVAVVFSLFWAWKVIAVVGIFDYWIDFRKYFVRNKNEGDFL